MDDNNIPKNDGFLNERPDAESENTEKTKNITESAVSDDADGTSSAGSVNDASDGAGVPEKSGENIPTAAQDKAPPKTPPKKTKTLLIILIACVVTITLLVVAALLSAARAQEEDAKASSVQVSLLRGGGTEPSGGANIPSGKQPGVSGGAATEAKTSDSRKSGGKSSGKVPTTVPSVEKFGQQLTLPPKNGDNHLSDDPDNKYIAAVVKKYGADPNNLVAVYAVPERGNNFVLEFKSGKPKTVDTLVKVYQVDQNGNIKVAADKPIYNVGVSYVESVLIMSLARTFIIPENSDYFTTK